MVLFQHLCSNISEHRVPGVRWHLERVDADAAVLPAGRSRAPTSRFTGIQFYNFLPFQRFHQTFIF